MAHRGSVVFAAILLVLVVSLLAYMNASHAQSYQNGSADTFNATPDNQSGNNALSGNESSVQSDQTSAVPPAPPQPGFPDVAQNGMNPESVSVVVPPETESFNQPAQTPVPDISQSESGPAFPQDGNVNVIGSQDRFPADCALYDTALRLNASSTTPSNPAIPALTLPGNKSLQELQEECAPVIPTVTATGSSGLALTAAVSGGGYGVMDNDPSVNCPIISAPGTYVVPMNYSGAPNSASPLGGNTCVKITSSNVVFDCAGYSLTNNGANTGILIVGPVSNVTVRNCSVFNYFYGILAYHATNISILNNAAPNSWYNLYINSTNRSLVSNNNFSSVLGAYNFGIYMYASSSDILSNNTADNHGQSGIYVYISSNNTLSNNTASSCYQGIIADHSNQTVLSGNFVNHTSQGDIILSLSNNSVICNNVLNDTSGNIDWYGISLSSSSNNTLCNNNISGHEYSFYFASGSNNNSIYNNNANNNQFGVQFGLSNYNVIYNNTFDNGGTVSLGSSNFTLVANNTILNTTYYAFSSSNSRNETVQNLTLGNATSSNTVSFTANDISIKLSGPPSVPDPAGFVDIGRFVNVSTDTGAFINLSYTAADVAFVDESLLVMSKYDGYAWYTDPTSFSYSHGVNTASKYVFANLYQTSSYSYVFGPLVFQGFNLTTLSSGCPVITAPGNYLMSVDSTGSPNSAGPFDNSGRACVTINASNVVFDCGGHSITGNGTGGYGILVQNSANHVTLKNCNIGRYTYGIYMYGATSSVISNNTVEGAYASCSGSGSTTTCIGNDAIVLDSSSSNTVTNNRMFDNAQGLLLQDGSHTNVINNNTARDNYYWDLYVSSSGTSGCANSITNMTGSGGLPINYTNETVTWENMTASEIFICGVSLGTLNNDNITNANHNNGLVLSRSSSVHVTNLTAYDDYEGIYITGCSGGIIISNSTVVDSGRFDFDIDAGSLCNNLLSNVTGSGGRPINYTYTPVSWSGITSSEIILCGVTSSTLTNVTVHGSDAPFNQNNALFMIGSSHVTVVNSSSNQNDFGIFNELGSNNNFINNTIMGNREHGIYSFWSASNNLFANNSVYGNAHDGIQIYYYSSGNVLSGNNVTSNGWSGITLTTVANSNTLINNTVDGNTNGIYLQSVNSNIISNNTAQENSQYDLYNNAQGTSDCINTVTTLIGSAGRPINYSYTPVSWSGITSSEIFLCNADGSNVDGVTVNGSDVIGNDGVVLFYTDNANVTDSMSWENYRGYFLQYSNYNDMSNDTTVGNSQQGLYLYGSSNNLMNSTVSDSNAQNGFYLDIFSDYNTILNSTANYSFMGVFAFLSSHETVANTEIYGNRWDGLQLQNSTNDITANSTSHDNAASGFVLVNSASDTFVNDTAFGNNFNGFYAGSSNFNTYVNDSSYNNNGYGIDLDTSNNNAIYDCSVDNGFANGIELIRANNNVVYNNNASNNGNNKGIDLYISNNNVVYNNTADGNNQFGIYVYASSGNNTLYDNTAENNPQYGFYLGSDNNSLHDNSAQNNNYGFRVESSNNNLSDNGAYNNSYSGFYLASGRNNLSGSTAGNNTYGIYIASNNNFVTNSVVLGNYYYGIELDLAKNNLVTDTTLDNHTGGIFLMNSGNNSFARTTCHNAGGGFYLRGGDYYNPDGGTDNNSFTDSNLSDGASCGAVDLYYSHNNSFVNVDVSYASYEGVSVYGSDNNTFTNVHASNGYIGVDVYGHNNRFKNVEASNGGYIGFYLSSAFNSSLLNVTASNNTIYGIEAYCSDKNNLTNITVQENGVFDFDLWPSCSPYIPPYCQNSVANMLGSGNRPVFYSNTSVSLDSAQVSEIVLCQAHSSVITNTVVNGSATLLNDGVLIFNTYNSLFSNLSSADNYYGVYERASNGDSFTNVTATGNAQSGFTFESDYVNDVSGSNSSGNGISGFSLDSSGFNTFTNDTAIDNPEWAFTSTTDQISSFATNLDMGTVNVSFESFDISIRNTTSPVVSSLASGSPGAELNIQSTNVSPEIFFGSEALICDGNGNYHDSAFFTGNFSGAWSYMTNDTGYIYQSDVPVDMVPLSSPTVIWDSSSNATASLSAPIPIGFNVPMFGRNDTYVTVSSDGNVYLNNGPPIAANPCDNGDHFIGIYGAYMQVSSGDVEYGVEGSAPNRVFIIYFNNVSSIFDTDASGGFTFQIKLFENATPVMFNTGQIDDPTGYLSLGRYVEAVGNAYYAPPYIYPYLFLNISYRGSDLGDLDPGTITMFKNSEIFLDNAWHDPSTFANIYGVDTDNGFVYANITDVGSTYAPFVALPNSTPVTPPVTPPSSPPPSQSTPPIPLSLSATMSPCPAQEMTVTASGGAGTQLRLILTQPYGGTVAQETAGSDGMVTFPLSVNGTYEVDGSRSGYIPTTLSFTFVTCPSAPTTPPPPPSQPQCTSDAQCSLIQFCNLSVGMCQPVTGKCGYPANHVWNKYECCANADCQPGNACIAHACKVLNLTGDDEGLVGGQGQVKATVGGKPFVNATLQINMPDGGSFQTTTDANGDATLPFTFQGNYTVSLVVAGTSVKTHLIAVALPPPVTQPSRPTVVEQPVNYCWALPVIVAMILAYLAYRKWRAGKNKKK